MLNFHNFTQVNIVQGQIIVSVRNTCYDVVNGIKHQNVSVECSYFFGVFLKRKKEIGFQ